MSAIPIVLKLKSGIKIKTKQNALVWFKLMYVIGFHILFTFIVANSNEFKFQHNSDNNYFTFTL